MVTQIRSILWLSVLVVVELPPIYAQRQGDVALARKLADQNARALAIEELTHSPAAGEQLMSIARASFDDVDSHDLAVGLADAFGQLGEAAGIPFLVKNLGLRRDEFVDLRPWLKTEAVIQHSFPCVAALIKIGPLGSRAAILRFAAGLNEEDRLAAIFVVAHVLGVPEAAPFLRNVVARGKQEAAIAEYGLHQ